MDTVVTVRRRELIPHLAGDPVGNVQSLYLCHRAPDAPAEAVLSGPGGTIAGFLLRGGPSLSGVHPASARLHATMPAAAAALALRWWRATAGGGAPSYLTLPLWAEGVVRAALPSAAGEASWSVDVRAVCTPADFRPPAVHHCVVWVDRANAAGLCLPPGWEHDLPNPGGEGLCACVRLHGRIAARAGGAVQPDDVGYVQRVQTLPEHRRRGCASSAVAAVTCALFSRHRVAAYHHDEANSASAATCAGLGFRPHGRAAVLTRRPAGG